MEAADSLEKAAAYAEEHDVDVVVDGAVVPCPSTLGILEAFQAQREKDIRERVANSYVAGKLATIGKPVSDFCVAIVTAVKDREKSAAEVASAFGDVSIGTWINDPEQKYGLLHFAARYDRADVAEMAVREGCSLSALTCTDRTPADYAVECGASRATLDALAATPEGATALTDALGPEKFFAFSRDSRWKPPDAPVLPAAFVSVVKSMAIEAAESAEEERRSKKARVDEDEPFECMICMDAAPTTIVYPCGHCVACSDCSVGLRATADKNVCVRCRRPIERIED